MISSGQPTDGRLLYAATYRRYIWEVYFVRILPLIECSRVYGRHEGEEARRPRGTEKSCSHGRTKRIGTAEVGETQ